MKVLFLTNIPSPYRVDFFSELGKSCDLTVIYEREKSKERDEKWKSEGYNYKEIYLKGVSVGVASVVSTELTKYLADKSYDVIVIGVYSSPVGMSAIKYLKKHKRPFIISSDGGMIKKDNFIKKAIKKYYISAANAWLSTGKVTDDYLVHYGAKEDRIYRYPFTSIKEEDILKKPLSKEEKLKIRELLNIKEEFVIISVGQFIYRKGYDVLLKAMEGIEEDVGLYLIGGEATEEYKELIEKYKLKNIHFVSFKTKNELAEYYKAADLFVLPTREDIWGLVINEAMSFGLPVITTDKCNAGLELIDEGIGSIVEVDATLIKKQVDKWIKTLDNIEDNQKISTSIIDKIKNYTIEEMAKRHIEIFDKYIENCS